MKLVAEWKKLWKAWTIQLAALGIVLPDLLQVLADNSSLMPWFDDGTKSALRLACLILIVVLRPIQQKALTKED